MLDLIGVVLDVFAEAWKADGRPEARRFVVTWAVGLAVLLAVVACAWKLW